MKLWRARCAFLLVTALASTGHAGTSRDALRPGARVRLTLLETPDHLTRERIIGLLVSVDPENVVVTGSPGQPSRTVAIDELRSFEVRARKGSAGRGALIGLVAGATGGVVVSKIICADGECSGETDYSGFVTGVLGVGGALFGAGTGALIGGRFQRDGWEEISLRDIRMGIAPSGDGVRLRFSLALP